MGLFDRGKPEEDQDSQADWLAERARIANFLYRARTFGGTGPEDPTLAVQLRPDERALLVATGTYLVEPRRLRAHWKAAPGPITFAVTRVSGPGAGIDPVADRGLTPLDSGDLTFTTQRVVFSGSAQTRDWQFANLIGFEHLERPSFTTIATTDHQHLAGFVYDIGQAEEIRFAIAVGIARFNSQLDDLVADLQSQLDEIDRLHPGAQPVTPAAVAPAAVTPAAVTPAPASPFPATGTPAQPLAAPEPPSAPAPALPEPPLAEPMTPEPVTPEPVTPEPVTPEPVTPEPVTPEPVTPEAAIPDLVAEEPMPEGPVAEGRLVEEPMVEEPMVEEPMVEEPMVEEPMVEEPVVPESALWNSESSPAMSASAQTDQPDTILPSSPPLTWGSGADLGPTVTSLSPAADLQAGPGSAGGNGNDEASPTGEIPVVNTNPTDMYPAVSGQAVGATRGAQAAQGAQYAGQPQQPQQVAQQAAQHQGQVAGQTGTAQQMPPGWYPDPWRIARVRWWDGYAWTAYTSH